MAKIINFGSLNIDHVYHVSHLVKAGETISSRSYHKNSGGKGLNQSIALARAGASVFHAGCIGPDGDFLLDILQRSGVNTDFIVQTESPGGHAIIQVDDRGENSIILYPGANGCITCEHIHSVMDKSSSGDFILLQNEINNNKLIMELAAEKGLFLCMNFAPFDRTMAEELPLHLLDILFVNETEGAALSGKEIPTEIVEVLCKKLSGCAIVLTLGKDGAIYGSGDTVIKTPAQETSVADTTAAGDTFTGYFLAARMKGQTPENCLKEASLASAVTVSRQGAADSIPYRDELLI